MATKEPRATQDLWRLCLDTSEGGKKPRRRRAFTPEFKAEIVELRQHGDRSIGQVARDFDLTETAVRDKIRTPARTPILLDRTRADPLLIPTASKS